jgi:predicted nucleic acid-binding protein
VAAFVDTNIIVYAFGRDEFKVSISEGLLGQQPTISTQVLNEFLSVCRIKLGMDRPTRHRLAIELMSACRIVALDSPIVLKAMDIETRTGLAFWDALIVAASLLSGCDILYSEDMQHGHTIEGLTIINPFLSRP